MSKINVLPKSIAELIAAGEVVERPGAVIKELVENSMDAGATKITVEIKRGGILYMSVTDNGSGIAREDVPTAFCRHATSKISKAEDLDAIFTLGFRGEALAAISAVSKTEVITRTADETEGTRCVVEGGVQTVLEDVGCDIGTIITVKDIFYNTPARMKFLKSDVTEANNIAAIIDRMALSHPEIAFRFIRDGKQVLTTAGDGNLNNVIYSVLGREFASSLIAAEDNIEGIKVSGMVCKPVYCRQNRNGEFFFLNGRLIRSNTAMAALEQAYKNSAMVGKFPCCVLFITVPPETVDVNVHPAKTEVRFSDERKIFNAVYYTVKNALSKGDTRPEIKINPTFNPYTPVYTEKAEQTKISVIKTKENEVIKPVVTKPVEKPISAKPLVFESPKFEFTPDTKVVKPETVKKVEYEETKKPIAPVTPTVTKTVSEEIIAPSVRYIGQAFNTYVIAEREGEIYFIDKHAAHERMLYNSLKKDNQTQMQELLTPLTITLTKEEYSAITGNTDTLLSAGFDVEDFGNGTVIVRAIPSILLKEDIQLLITEIAGTLLLSNTVNAERIDDIYHTVACKAAIKGNRYTSDYELKSLAEKVLNDQSIMYCPHGRPVAFKLTKKELEKYFGRTGSVGL